MKSTIEQVTGTPDSLVCGVWCAEWDIITIIAFHQDLTK